MVEGFRLPGDGSGMSKDILQALASPMRPALTRECCPVKLC